MLTRILSKLFPNVKLFTPVQMLTVEQAFEEYEKKLYEVSQMPFEEAEEILQVREGYSASRYPASGYPIAFYAQHRRTLNRR